LKAAGHEEQDANQFAHWGFDLLKYDLCSYPMKDNSMEETETPFAKMGQILATEDRDILFSLSEGGRADVWKWGREAGAQMRRISGDLAWGPKGVYSSWDNIVSSIDQGSFKRPEGPGGWNDPDYLLVGHMAYIPYNEEPPNVTIDRVLPPSLTPDEQLTQMIFWSLMAAPLMIGGDLTTLDQFSLSLLSNDEVIAIDQDVLGQPANKVSQSGKLSVWTRELEDGSRAVGIFNMGEREEMATHAGATLSFRASRPRAISGSNRTWETLTGASVYSFRPMAFDFSEYSAIRKFNNQPGVCFGASQFTSSARLPVPRSFEAAKSGLQSFDSLQPFSR
jgi:alpha-galactosidase